jgi:ATP-dependent DNA helicase RecG
MVETSDLVASALDSLAKGLVNRTPISELEGQTLDCKEDPSMRGAHGEITQSAPRSPKLAALAADCAACLANADGGVVVVGINDKAVGAEAVTGTAADTAWLQEQIRDLIGIPVTVCEASLEKGRVVAVSVATAGTPVKNTKGRYTRRQGRSCHPMEAAELGTFSSSRAVGDWSSAITAHTVADADLLAVDQLRAWLKDSGEVEKRAMADLDTPSLLSRLFLADATGRLNRAGELLCVRLPGRGPLIDFVMRPLPGAEASLRIAREEEPLATALTEIERTLDTQVPTHTMATGLVLGVLPAVPSVARREAIINAVSHRDWTYPSPVRIQLVAECLTVESAGRLLPGVTPDTILTATPRSRNSQLGRALRALRLSESEGIGVDRMYREMLRLGLEPPTITENADGSAVICTLVGGTPDAGTLRVVTAHEMLAQDVGVLLLLRHLRSHSSVNATTLAPVIQESHDVAVDTLSRARTLGIVAPTARNGRYRLADNVVRSLDARGVRVKHTSAEYDKAILAILEAHGEVRTRDIVAQFGVKPLQASRALAAAVGRGVVVSNGKAGAGSRYTAP